MGNAFGRGERQQRPVEVEGAILEVVAANWQQIGHVDDDTEKRESERAIAMRLPA